MEVEQKRMKRELKRAELRSQEQQKVKDLDVLGMARHELGLKQPDADSTVHTGTGTMNWKHGEGQGSDQGSQAGAAEEEDDDRDLTSSVHALENTSGYYAECTEGPPVEPMHAHAHSESCQCEN